MSINTLRGISKKEVDREPRTKVLGNYKGIHKNMLKDLCNGQKGNVVFQWLNTSKRIQGMMWHRLDMSP